ncbi:MAG: YgiQ family radical SAM protein [Treponema sp.]|nr:YgiQ family radical SAM protein [Treponema sp.]
MLQGNLLPVCRRDMDERGWEECDFIFVSGDAYVDHPSFAAALLCRMLEAEGFRVGIIAQPDWKNPSSYTVLGRPRLAFLAGAGNMDSMVAHYTASKRIRSDDAYSPDGKSGYRPDRAILVYVQGIRQAYKDTAVIIGGIEASLRRFAHYDYWSDTIRRSILLDSKADILVYGMGEKPLLNITRRLKAGESIGSIRDERGTCVRVHGKENAGSPILLPAYQTVKENDPSSLRAYAEHFMIQKQNADPLSAKTLAEENDGDRWVIQNPPALPLSTEELDKLYELPFTRKAHPMYKNGIPALKEVSFSLVSSRGCFGGCSFCAITNHQGRAVTGRSKESLLREARTLVNHEDFKGYIHDVGGPSANFFRPACELQKKGGFCAERECLYPTACPKLKADHGQYLQTLKALREIQGIKKVFIRSGIRFDFILFHRKHGNEFLQTLCKHHVSGQLKVAPEHISAAVLDVMGKCAHFCYEQFRKDYAAINKQLGLKQYLLPYFISSHPGASFREAQELSKYLKKTGFVPEQTQDFYPTPATMSTVMYRTGLDPRTMQPVYVAKGEKERRKQKDLITKKT